MADSARKSSSVRPQLAAVKWLHPSSPPDTSDLDDDWSEETPPRHSFIALKAARAKALPLPPGLARSSAPPMARPSLAPSSVLAAEITYDVWDSPRAMLVLMDLPGVDAEQVKLSLGSHALYLELTVPQVAEHPGIAGGHHELSIQLPDGISPDALDASFSHGVLRIRISKAEAGPRHVVIATE
jgi:HSP20 family molecular chaperone IbpA